MPEDYVLVLNPALYNEALALVDTSVYGDRDPIKDGKFDGLFGFSSVVCGYGLQAGVKGALIPVDGIAVASRPFGVADEACYTEYGVVTDEETGFSMSIMRHGDPATGGAYINAACRFGAVLTQPTRSKLLV